MFELVGIETAQLVTAAGTVTIVTAVVAVVITTAKVVKLKYNHIYWYFKVKHNYSCYRNQMK